jgi:elongation factor Ts
MNVDVAELKLLRKKTSAGMLDCMKALSEAKGDTAIAEGLIKEWGLAGVEKRSDRAANEGKIFIHTAVSSASMAELVCETDFAARNELFLDAGSKIADLTCRKKLISPDREIEALVAGIASVLKENLGLGRVAFMEAGPRERIGAYVHGDGRVGALVRARADAESAFADPRVAAFVHDLALHVAAFRPLFLDEGSVPDSYRREKDLEFRKQIEDDEKLRGKGTKILEGILSGKMKKQLAEVCLLGHAFVKDDKLSVAEALRILKAETGHSLEVMGFEAIKIGEG